MIHMVPSNLRLFCDSVNLVDVNRSGPSDKFYTHTMYRQRIAVILLIFMSILSLQLPQESSISIEFICFEMQSLFWSILFSLSI